MVRLSFLAGLLSLTLVGCQSGNAKVANSGAPVVPVALPTPMEVTDYVEYTGRINAVSPTTIVPRVTGYIVSMNFKEGDDVKAGETLFEIDPRPYQAQYEAAKAQVAQNVAGLAYATATNKRFKELRKIDKGAVSDRELEQYQAQEDQAKASLDLAKANLDSAELNLKWTKVTSPIDGHISRYFLTTGNLVNQDVTQLTTVVSMDPMYVNFDMDEPTLLDIKRAINRGTLIRRSSSAETMPEFLASTFGLLNMPLGRRLFAASAMMYPGRVGRDADLFMQLQGETDFPHRGTINFVDNQVNSGTGSIQVRGVFKNPRPPGGTYLFTPGMFVRVRMPIGQKKPALLVIDSAVVSEQGQKKLYVLDAENKVKDIPVTLGALQKNGLRVVTQGLNKDDRVLIGSWQTVRPRMLVDPEEWVRMPTQDDPSEPKQSGKKGSKK